MPIALTALLFVGCILALALILLLSHQEKFSSLKKIHREQKIGSLISALALGWGGYQGYELLGQDFPTIASVIPIAIPALIVGVYFLMDYIFTRAMGGFMIMLICELLYRSQNVEMGGRILFSFVGYAFAILGMYMIGQPWRFKNVLFKSIDDKAYGAKIAYTAIGSVVLMFVPFVVSYV
jgi:hypothetical protein